jgi:hypothetical protein
LRILAEEEIVDTSKGMLAALKKFVDKVKRMRATCCLMMMMMSVQGGHHL